MPTIKRYISNDGTEHPSVDAMRAHEIVNDVALATSTTMDDVRGWLAGGDTGREKRDAFLRVAVRVGRARPADQKRARVTKSKAAGDAGNGPGGDAATVSGGSDSVLGAAELEQAAA